MGGHRCRSARPRGGADGVRQDPQRLPVEPRPAAHQRAACRPHQAHPGALRQPAQGPRGRRRAQPAQPPHRHPPHRRAARTADPRGDRRRPLGRHPGRRPSQAGHPAARHHDHDAGVAVPDAHQPGPREPARGRDGDRRRGARRGRHQARRPPRGHPRAARRAPRQAGPAHRPQRDGAAAGGGGAVPRRQRSRRDRRAAQHQGVGPQGRRAGRRHDRPRRDSACRGLRVRRADPGPVDLAARRGARRRPDRAAQEHDRLRQQPSPRRAADRPAQRDRHRAGDG